MLSTVCDINNWAVYRKLYVHIIRTIEASQECELRWLLKTASVLYIKFIDY